jgi:hypothetical protein
VREHHHAEERDYWDQIPVREKTSKIVVGHGKAELDEFHTQHQTSR